MRETHPEVAVVTEEKRLPHSETKPFVLHLEEEFIIERLREEERREAMPGLPIETNHDANGKAPTSRLVKIYTDGGCRGNPGPGGWAAIIYKGPKPEEIYGYEKNTTNQRMELRAAIEGLRYLKAQSRVRLYSDSAYLLNAMNEGWLVKWESNGWKTAKKKPVKNAGLWRELLELARIHEVKWVKVKGHAGNPGNERCDALVKLAMDRGRQRT